MTGYVASLVIGLLLAPTPAQNPASLSALPVWDDGLSEMCYYDAVDTIYGKKRAYTRVQMVNRQWMNEDTGVKTDADDPHAVAVFKFNVAEQIPTENYNYRFLTTTFLRRPDLSPFKLATSSQEWCGTTYKELRWRADGLHYKSFSYFGDEGDSEWQLPAEVVPADALFLIARDVVARDKPRHLRLLASVRSSHQVQPNILEASIVPAANSVNVSTPIGDLKARRVDVKWNGPKTSFTVEAAPPHRLIQFTFGSVEGKIKFVERRAYWDHSWPSGFHAPGKAP